MKQWRRHRTKNLKVSEIDTIKLNQSLQCAYVSFMRHHFVEEHKDKKSGEQYHYQNKIVEIEN